MPETKLESRTPRAADTAQPLRPRRLGHLPVRGGFLRGLCPRESAPTGGELAEPARPEGLWSPCHKFYFPLRLHTLPL